MSQYNFHYHSSNESNSNGDKNTFTCPRFTEGSMQMLFTEIPLISPETKNSRTLTPPSKASDAGTRAWPGSQRKSSITLVDTLRRERLIDSPQWICLTAYADSPLPEDTNPYTYATSNDLAVAGLCANYLVLLLWELDITLIAQKYLTFTLAEEMDTGDKPDDIEAFRKARIFYQSCMDVATRDARRGEPGRPHFPSQKFCESVSYSHMSGHCILQLHYLYNTKSKTRLFINLTCK